MKYIVKRNLHHRCHNNHYVEAVVRHIFRTSLILSALIIIGFIFQTLFQYWAGEVIG